MRRRTSCGSRATSMPSTVTSPAVGSSTQPRILSVVVLPAPLRPRKPMTSPRSIEKLEIVNRGELAVVLGQSFDFNHELYEAHEGSGR